MSAFNARCFLFLTFHLTFQGHQQIPHKSSGNNTSWIDGFVQLPPCQEHLIPVNQVNCLWLHLLKVIIDRISHISSLLTVSGNVIYMLRSSLISRPLPSFLLFTVRKSGRGPGTFNHVYAHVHHVPHAEHVASSIGHSR